MIQYDATAMIDALTSSAVYNYTYVYNNTSVRKFCHSLHFSNHEMTVCCIMITLLPDGGTQVYRAAGTRLWNTSINTDITAQVVVLSITSKVLRVLLCHFTAL